MSSLLTMWKRILSIAHRTGFTRNEAGVIVFLAAVLLTGGAISSLRGDGQRSRPDAREALAAQDAAFAARSMSPATEPSPVLETVGSDAGETAATAEGSKQAPTIIDINAANGAMLETLPGIGPSTAQKIIEHRKAKGPFARIEDLMLIKGIGPKKFEKIRLFITVR